MPVFGVCKGSTLLFGAVVLLGCYESLKYVMNVSVCSLTFGCPQPLYKEQYSRIYNFKLTEERMFFTLFRSHLGQFLDIANCPSIHVSIPKAMEVLLQTQRVPDSTEHPRSCYTGCVSCIPTCMFERCICDRCVLYSETLGPN